MGQLGPKWKGGIANIPLEIDGEAPAPELPPESRRISRLFYGLHDPVSSVFLNDAIPEEHKSGIDMSRDLLRRAMCLSYVEVTLTGMSKMTLPFLFVLWFCLKLGTAYRLAAGVGFGKRLRGRRLVTASY